MMTKLIERVAVGHVYAIRCAATRQLYIGATADPETRKRQHFSDLRAGRHRCRKLQAVFDDFGEKSLKWRLLEIVQADPGRLEEKLAKCELAWIKDIGPALLLNNCDSIGYQCKDSDIVPGVSAKLKSAREAAGLTQVQAGERAGVHPVSIAKFETETTAPTLKLLIKLAAAYGVDVCDLIPASPRKPRKRKA